MFIPRSSSPAWEIWGMLPAFPSTSTSVVFCVWLQRSQRRHRGSRLTKDVVFLSLQIVKLTGGEVLISHDLMTKTCVRRAWVRYWDPLSGDMEDLGRGTCGGRVVPIQRLTTKTPHWPPRPNMQRERWKYRRGTELT